MARGYAAGFANPREMGKPWKLRSRADPLLGRSRCIDASLDGHMVVSRAKVNPNWRLVGLASSIQRS